MYSGRMTPARKEFNTNVKANVPKKTLVIMVPEKDIPLLRTWLDQVPGDFPKELSDFLKNARKQLGD